MNPKKSNFALEEGKLLGHIISKDGIKIDPSRVEAIQKIDIPRTKKEVQSFMLMGVIIPHNKGRHCPFRKSQLDS